jgi:hypothetical protein
LYLTNISVEILLHILGHSFFCRAPYFGTFLPSVVAVKTIKNFMRKCCYPLVLKMLVKLTPGGRNWQLIDPNSQIPITS